MNGNPPDRMCIISKQITFTDWSRSYINTGSCVVFFFIKKQLLIPRKRVTSTDDVNKSKGNEMKSYVNEKKGTSFIQFKGGEGIPWLRVILIESDDLQVLVLGTMEVLDILLTACQFQGTLVCVHAFLQSNWTWDFLQCFFNVVSRVRTTRNHLPDEYDSNF